MIDTPTPSWTANCGGYIVSTGCYIFHQFHVVTMYSLVCRAATSRACTRTIGIHRRSGRSYRPMTALTTYLATVPSTKNGYNDNRQGKTWWRHKMETFSALLALCARNSPGPVNYSHNGQWRGPLMFSLICVWINDWVNNREAGDLKHHRGHYDVSVMTYWTHDDVLT